jgi:hypothetical protein
MSRIEFVNRLEYELAKQKARATGRRTVAKMYTEEEARAVNCVILEREVERWRMLAKSANLTR